MPPTAVTRFADDVRAGRFPSSEETYHAADTLPDELKLEGPDRTAESCRRQRGARASTRVTRVPKRAVGLESARAAGAASDAIAIEVVRRRDGGAPRDRRDGGRPDRRELGRR